MLRASHALPQLSLRTILCGTENWCPYLYRGERAGSKSLIRSSRTGGDADEFQGLSRGRKAVGKDAGRRPGGSNWLPSSRDRLSRERMRLACAFLGKQKTTAQESKVVEEAIPWLLGSTLSPGQGYWKATGGRFCCRLTAKEPVSGFQRPVALRIHGTQSPPKPFLMGGVISIFQAEKPRAEGQLAPSTPAPPPPLAGGG